MLQLTASVNVDMGLASSRLVCPLADFEVETTTRSNNQQPFGYRRVWNCPVLLESLALSVPYGWSFQELTIDDFSKMRCGGNEEKLPSLL